MREGKRCQQDEGSQKKPLELISEPIFVKNPHLVEAQVEKRAWDDAC